MDLHVLLKQQGDHVTVHSVYEDLEDLKYRVKRIAKANSPYRLRDVGDNHWRVGPEDDEDEGFFGNRPVDLIAVTAKFYPEGSSPPIDIHFPEGTPTDVIHKHLREEHGNHAPWGHAFIDERPNEKPPRIYSVHAWCHREDGTTDHA